MIFQADMTLSQGLQLTVIAMGIVFVLLLAISFILRLFVHIPGDAPKVEVKKPIPTKTPSVTSEGVDWSQLEADEDMMVAALVASMEAAGDNKETNYRITKITRL